MRRAAKPRIAESLVSQMALHAGVKPLLASSQNSRARDGSPYDVRFARSGIHPQTVELSFLKDHPALAPAILLGFKLWGLNRAERTRSNLNRDLSAGLFAYLGQTGIRSLTLQGIDKALITGFIKWLNSEKAATRTTLLQPSVRARRFSAFISLLAPLVDQQEFGSEAARILDLTPRNLWRGRSRKVLPTPRLLRSHLDRIIQAAEREVVILEQRCKRGSFLLNDGRKRLNSGGSFRADQALCIATLNELFPGIIPDFRKIRDTNVALANAATIFGRQETAGYFYASGRDLAPIVVLLSVATAFNPDTVLSLNRTGITRGERLGQPFVRIVGQKARAVEDQVAILDATPGPHINIETLLDLLERLTARLRPHVSYERDKDRLFLFVPERGLKNVSSFGGSYRDSADMKLRIALISFAKENDLERFNLNQIRPTILDEIQLVTGDLMKAKSIGQQRNIETLWKHYTSSGTSKRYQERLGEVLLVRERWHQSGGAIDPRTRVLGASMDRGAATPGFICLDPFDSPIAGQTKGRLCAAYGACPSCPLAAANIVDAMNVGLYEALRTAILSAHLAIGSKAWIKRWSNILIDLDALLGFVQPAVRQEALRLQIVLPAVG